MSRTKTPRIHKHKEPIVNVDVTNTETEETPTHEPTYALQMPKDKRIMLPKLPLSRVLTNPKKK